MTNTLPLTPDTPTPTCTRRISFDAAHRVMEHEHRCQLLHGHRYVVEATFQAKELDALGRVIDFGVIKEKLGAWIDTNWDHNTILHENDKELGDVIANQTGQEVFYLPFNPTAEHLAVFLLEEVCSNLFADTDVICVKVKVEETANCFAEVWKPNSGN